MSRNTLPSGSSQVKQFLESLSHEARSAYDRMTDAEREPIHYWLHHEPNRAEALIKQYIDAFSKLVEQHLAGEGVVDPIQETEAERLFRGADTADEMISRLESFLWDREHQGQPQPEEQVDFSKLRALIPTDDQGPPATAADQLYLFTVAHLEWMQADEPIETHPAVALIRDWWSAPKPVEPYRPNPRAVLANWDATADKDRFLLSARQPVPVPEGGQLVLDLPELTPKGCASWLLDLFDRAGGQSMRQGRGAPWDLHVWLGAILHLGIAQRDGQWHCLNLPTEEVVKWLHPDGWPNRARDWRRFPEALHRMNRELGFVYLEGVGSVQVVGATRIPEKPDEPIVELIVRIPKTAAHGPRVNWRKLCQYRQQSAVVYRAYLAAVDFMHESAEQGKPIEQAVRDEDGSLRPNPSTRYVRGLTKGELTEMIGLDTHIRVNPKRAISAFERLADDGIIDLVREGSLWRIFGPTKSYPQPSS